MMVKATKNQEYYQRNKERLAAYGVIYRGKNKERKQAQECVRVALKQGLLVRPKQCELCGTQCTPHGHHDDYGKQLTVRWVCVPCHREIHGGLKHATSAVKKLTTGENHPFAKLTEERVKFIRESDLSGYALAKLLCISEQNISLIRQRKAWKHI